MWCVLSNSIRAFIKENKITISSEEARQNGTSSSSLANVSIANLMLPPSSRSGAIEGDVSSIEPNVLNDPTTLTASSYENNFDSDGNRTTITDQSVTS